MPGVKPLPNSCCIVKWKIFVNIMWCLWKWKCKRTLHFCPLHTVLSKRYKYCVHLYRKQLMNIVNCIRFFFATVPDLLLLLLFHKICTRYFFLVKWIITLSRLSCVRLNITYFFKWFLCVKLLHMFIYQCIFIDAEKNYKIFFKFIDFQINRYVKHHLSK